MKLRKKKLLTLVTPTFLSLGYTFFKGKGSNSDDLFIKKVGDLHLSIGMNIHRFYDDRFTADMYLSPTTCFACWWGDIPFKSYTRPGHYLTDEELSKYAEDGHIVKDVWWHSYPEAIDDFFSVFRIAEKRMLADTGLIEIIMKSKDVELLNTQSKSVIASIEKAGTGDVTTYIDGLHYEIPTVWYEEASKVLLKTYAAPNQYQINRLAEDAYRQFILARISERT